MGVIRALSGNPFSCNGPAYCYGVSPNITQPNGGNCGPLTDVCQRRAGQQLRGSRDPLTPATRPPPARSSLTPGCCQPGTAGATHPPRPRWSATLSPPRALSPHHGPIMHPASMLRAHAMCYGHGQMETMPGITHHHPSWKPRLASSHLGEGISLFHFDV